MWTAKLGLALAFLATHCVAATNEFRNPSRSKTSAIFDVGDSQTIKWNTSYTYYNISLWQTVSDTHIRKVYTNTDGDGVGTHEFAWRVKTYDANMSVSDQFFFRLRPKRGSSFTFNSSTFTIRNNTASGTPDSKSGSNDTAIKVGLGVGLGVSIPLVLIAGVWIGMKAVRQRRPSKSSIGSNTPLAQLEEQENQAGFGSPLVELPLQSNEIHEAPPYKSPVELPGHGIDR